MKEALILAGGLGTRMGDHGGGVPKALMTVGGAPLLDHHLRLAARHGIERVFVLTGHGAEAVAEFCGDGSRWGLALECLSDPAPMGTGGAVLAALPRLAGRFVVLYGDTLAEVDLTRLAAGHAASGAAATLLAHPNDHPQDSDLLSVGLDGRILGFHPYPHPPGALPSALANAALHIIERDALDGAWPRQPLDLGKHVLPMLLERGMRLHAHRTPEYIKDAGTPARLDKVRGDWQAGIPSRQSLSTPRPAVFLDRDGTINHLDGHISDPARLRLIPGAAQALARLAGAGFRLVLVTNQPVIARGECDEAGLARIHGKLEQELAAEGVFLDAIHVCPHHPDRGFAGERPEYKIACGCRKPEIGMVEQAAQDLNIDMARSWMVGDSARDMDMAHRAGLRAILVQSGESGRNHPAATAVVPSLREAAALIAEQGRFEP